MPLSTTVIGSFPKPPYLHIPDWFRTSHSGPFTEQHNRFLENCSASETEELIIKATREIVALQAEACLDVITDGEVRRESYILHFCRTLEGFDLHNLFSKICRDGAVVTDVPRIVSEVTPREGESWVWKEWKTSQDLSTLPIKITLPGPMTIINSTEDQYYNDEKVLGRVLAQIINSEVKALVSAGCKYIQVLDTSQEISCHTMQSPKRDGPLIWEPLGARSFFSARILFQLRVMQEMLSQCLNSD